MKPPIARIGGKSRLAKYIISKFPKNYNIYVEPFVGAGNIIFRIEKDDSIKEVINDKDKAIYTIMKGLQKKGDYINDNINRNVSRTQFYSLANKHDPISEIEKIKFSFFGKGKSYDKEGRTIKTDFSVYKDRLKNVTILNKNFSDVIKQYDSVETFFYLDPPYESENQKDYKDYVTPEEVFDSIKNIKGLFLLSYNYSSNIKKIFKQFKMKIVTTTYAQTSFLPQRKVKELLISNY